MTREKELIQEFVAQAMCDIQLDIDVDYCKKHNIKFDNHEIDVDSIVLFDSKSNKTAYDLVSKLR